MVMCSILGAQDLETTVASAYDRGLVHFLEPFAPTGNPALLVQQSNFRFNLELHRASNTYYQVSSSYPLSPFTSLGVSWFSLGYDHVKSETSGIFEVNHKRQKVLFSLGHLFPIQWGQQLEVDFSLNRFQTYKVVDPKEVDYTNDQLIQCFYRIGLCQDVGPRLKIGVLSVPILYFRYQTFTEAGLASKMGLFLWKEEKTRTRIPLIALQWIMRNNLALVLSNRSKSNRDHYQLAGEIKIDRFIITGAICHNKHLHEYETIFGLGGHLRGFDLFSSYHLLSNDFRISVSFAPERMKKLVQVDPFLPSSTVLYPYRLQHNRPSYLTRIPLTNISEKPVEITMKGRGGGLPSISQQIELEKKGLMIIEIPVPPALMTIPPGHYQYHIQIVAYQRGKQVIEQPLWIEMKDPHDWAGDPLDLIYFIKPECDIVFAESRNIIAQDKKEKKTQTAIEIAKRFYRFIQDSMRYIPDPRPLNQRQDRGQYPDEILKSRMGDCEDLSILMISLLKSVGIEASFVEFVKPDAEEGHIFIIFDSQINVSELVMRNENLQKYIVRKNKNYESRCFIPLELTHLEYPFEKAWQCGLEIYEKEGVERGGLAEGWFRIIDTW